MGKKTFNVSAYTSPRYTYIGYSIPVTVEYNERNDVNGNILTIPNVYEKEGIVYAGYENGKDAVLYINADTKYVLKDGSEFDSGYSIPCTYMEKGVFEVFDISRAARMKKTIKEAFASIEIGTEKRKVK